MQVLRAILVVLVAGALATWVCWVHRLAGEPLGIPGLSQVLPSAPSTAEPSSALAGAAAKAVLSFTSNVECEPCHREIYQEWFQDQHALAWFNTPLLAQDPKLVECNNCHAPVPILETGIDKLPIIRTGRFEEGVGCLECHQNRDRVEGPRGGTRGACNPTYNESFAESIICSSCHAAHGSYAEWQGSDWARKGYTCQACHMPLVDAPVVTGGPVLRRRSHRMRTQRDPEVLRAAVTVDASIVDGRKVEIRVANVGAAHNVPGEISNRELFLAAVVRDRDGRVVREHRESFKTPRRTQRASIPSTQLRPGETRTITYDLEPEHGKVEIFLGYKLLLYVPDDRSILVEEKNLDF